jgi:hypothetical protein
MAVGVKETKEVVALGLALGKAVVSIADDGKVSVLELAKLIPVVPKISQGVTGLKDVPAELADMDAAELQELLDMVEAELGKEYAAKPVVEGLLQLGLAVLQVVKDLKGDKA